MPKPYVQHNAGQVMLQFAPYLQLHKKATKGYARKNKLQRFWSGYR